MNRQQIEKKTAAVIERQLYQRGYATVEDSLILMGWLEEKYFDTLEEGTGALSRKGMLYEFIQAQLFYEAVFCICSQKRL